MLLIVWDFCKLQINIKIDQEWRRLLANFNRNNLKLPLQHFHNLRWLGHLSEWGNPAEDDLTVKRCKLHEGVIHSEDEPKDTKPRRNCNHRT